MTAAETLVDLLVANRRTDQYIGYLEGDSLERRVPYAQLHERALGILWRLRQVGVRRGDHLIIFLNNNEAFIDGFWAALAGGITPVPLAVGTSAERRLKLLRVARQLGAPWLYTDRQRLDRLRECAAEHGQTATFEKLRARAFLIDDLDEVGRAADPVSVKSGDVAFVQYSSGATSAPKGVVLTHRNILANTRGASEALGFTDRDVALSWMPLTHDMGLIGFFIMMFAHRMQLNLMPTDLFIRRPLLWTTFLSRKRATLSSSPNFGFRHYLNGLGDRSVGDIDLSPVRLIFNGAEPISVELCDEFMSRLAPAGLARTAMCPVYGLAEASLAMTLPTPGRPYRAVQADRLHLRVGDRVREVPAGAPGALSLMQLGRAIPYAELRIADEVDKPVAGDCVGHVQIRGENVTAGYYKAPEATGAAFTADGWLRTGDLGFEHDGELVIAGRDKEVVFVNGQTCFPHDIEASAQRASGLELGKVAAVGWRPPGADTEQLALFVVHRGPPADFLPVARDVARLVSEHMGLEVARVVPIRRMPKTTSGKIQRVALEESLRNGEFDAELAELERLRNLLQPAALTANDIERLILGILDDMLPDKRIDPDDSLFEIGVSSLTLVQIHERLDREFPGQIDLTDLFDRPTPRLLAELLARK